MSSITRGKNGGYAGLCDGCGLPLERAEKGPWRASEPLTSRQR
ncbi:hypothetical protein NSU_pLA1175 (plasmid) [Novosphingobium pentaromativorans US6-1]|uniref:Uncharacterized protein n=1 Tax=Novosphingobium pentaromativorans US6-1 TaxID=1088721 RepID=G6ELA2_9SPHN|nr:hypothetical protein NSU_pLA1175 [Novosphingobium pentaromativorans US6-1]